MVSRGRARSNLQVLSSYSEKEIVPSQLYHILWFLVFHTPSMKQDNEFLAQEIPRLESHKSIP